MRIYNIKKSALGALKGNWGFAIGLFIISQIIINIVPQLLSYSVKPESSLFVLSSVIIVAYSLFIMPINSGYNWVFLDLIRGKRGKISDLFMPFSNHYWTVFATMILQSIFVFLWSLLFVIPGIIKGLAYSQSMFILKDHPEFTANKVITESRKLMDGYKWKFFLLQLSFIGWGILSILTLGIGLLWLVPYITAANAQFYEKLIENDTLDTL